MRAEGRQAGAAGAARCGPPCRCRLLPCSLGCHTPYLPSLPPPLWWNPGCYAEYVAADADWVAKVPASLPLEQAAGVPLVALTAWQALQLAKPQAGQRALVTAAAGGVGHMAVQVRGGGSGRVVVWPGCPLLLARVFFTAAAALTSPLPLLLFAAKLLQLAKALGLHVVGIAGPKNLEWVKSLGADEVRRGSRRS